MKLLMTDRPVSAALPQDAAAVEEDTPEDRRGGGGCGSRWSTHD
mgnify:CR=1 FL=1